MARRILVDRAAAEDVAAEAMARAFTHWDRIGLSVSHRTGWVLRVTTNLAIDVVRQRERSSDLADPDVGAPMEDAVDDQDALTTRLTLIGAMRELPDRQREAVALRYLAGLSQAEVAEALGVSPGTVARHVNRGLTRLRERVAVLAPAAGDVRGLIQGGHVKVRALQEAKRLVGTDTIVEAHVTGVTHGGWAVDIGIPAILKGRGQLGPPTESRGPIGQDIECVIVEVDEERGLIVVSPPLRPEDAEVHQRRRELIAALRIGDVRRGRVRSLVPFGAFVEVGEVYGLLHRSELGKPVTDPRDVLRIGQEVEVEVLATDVELQRISLRLR